MIGTETNQDKYTKVWRIASYLEAEWSDFLLKNPENQTPNNSFDPMTDYVQPHFYRRVGELAGDCLQKAQINPLRYCDAGGATGRTLYEISHRVSSLTELVLVEPSAEFCKWAERLLTESDDLGWIPLVGTLEKPKYAKAIKRPEPINKEKEIYIYQAFAEEVPRPTGYFDLITCLNVVDRHSNPLALVRALYDLLAPNGILILSTPMEFEAGFTPDKERWVSDVNLLFSESEWNSIAEENIFYDFRTYRRKWMRYSSQAVVKQKKS